MKLRISDLMDGVRDDTVPIRAREIVASERIMEVTMEKIKNGTTAEAHVKRLGKGAVFALAAAALLALSAAGYAVAEWRGFALTAGMSRGEVSRMLDTSSRGVGYATVEPDGTTHYFDRSGNETLVLGAEEAAAYERQRAGDSERAVRESTSLVDVDTLDVLPRGITELAVDTEGRFADFAAGNGWMVLLRPEGGTGFALSAGDRASLSLRSNDACILQFFVFLDGALIVSEDARAQEHSFTFTADTPGAYVFGLVYVSASASSFTEGTLTVG